MLDLLIAHAGAIGAAPPLLAESDSARVFGLTPFVLGPGVLILVYLGIYRYYRNTDKTHQYEKETRIEASDLESYDHFLGERTGLRRRRMEGENSGSNRTRVRRFDVR